MITKARLQPFDIPIVITEKLMLKAKIITLYVSIVQKFMILFYN